MSENNLKNSLILNNKLCLSYPEGFCVLDKAEREKLSFIGSGPCECLSDPKRHMLISLGWKPLGGFSAFLLSAKEASKNTESRLKKGMKNFEYRSIGSAAKAVGSERAEGFRFEYKAQGVNMLGETLVVKHGKIFYYLNLYARKELEAESMEIWNEILSSAKWK